MGIEAIIGDYEAFYSQCRSRLARRGIDIDGYPLSHLAFRTADFGEYRQCRDALETFAGGNFENVWNGRPISKIQLQEPLPVGDAIVPLVELIPPPHRDTYRMGLEHLGVVIGEDIDAFADRHAEILDGQQLQSAVCQPWFLGFEDHTNVKFYRYSLGDVVRLEGNDLDTFTHVDDWQAEAG